MPRMYSFHSVKGGVGKSTLAVATALQEARHQPTYLIDADLTGTSLADVLRLSPPRWSGDIDLRAPPDGHQDDDAEVRTRLDEREEALAAWMSELNDEEAETPLSAPSAPEPWQPVGLTFLNDYLLFSPPPGEQGSVAPEAISWTMRGGPADLRVIPSSALPDDLARVLPIIYSEEHSAFLEKRFEELLGRLATAHGGACTFVFDTPPTVPGLSRAVISLGLRLGHEPKTPLIASEGLSPGIDPFTFDTRTFVVASLDQQDMRAAARWLATAADDVRLLLNRVDVDDGPNLDDKLRAFEQRISMTRDLFSAAPRVPASPELRYFRDGLTSAEVGSVLERVLMPWPAP